MPTFQRALLNAKGYVYNDLHKIATRLWKTYNQLSERVNLLDFILLIVQKFVLRRLA